MLFYGVGTMSKFFDVNNKFFTTLSKIWDLIILDIIFLIALFAFIGPACTALYYAIVKNIRRSRDYTWSTFWHSFKSNFRQGAVLGVLQLVVGAGLLFCYSFAVKMNPDVYIAQVYYWVTIALILLYFMISIYMYPLLSRFSMKNIEIIRMSLFLSFRHLPTTILGMLGFAAVILFWDRGLMFSPLVLVAPSVYVFLLSFPMEKVLHKYMPKKEDLTEEEQMAWYNE